MSNSTNGNMPNNAKINLIGSKLPSEILEVFQEFNNSIDNKRRKSVGSSARKVLERLNGQGKLSTIIDNLKSVNYCKEILKLNMASFIDEAGGMNIIKKGDRLTTRYYKKPLIIVGKAHYLTNDWYAPTMKNPQMRNNLQELYNCVNSLF